MRKLLDFDPLSKEAVWFDFNDRTQEVTLYQEQDCSNIVEANKSRQNDKGKFARQMRRKNGDAWLYATIPNIVIHKWKKELGVDLFDKNDEKKVFQLLNSPEYRWLKATTKSHGAK